MEQRTPAYLPASYAGRMVPAESHQYALLPYERQLIQTLGISEQEYRDFAEEIRRKSLERPPGYEHIPDIRNEPVTAALISIAVGAVFSVVAAALAPKPKQPSVGEQDSIEQRSLPNQQGRTRFNNSIGFDAAPGLAQLGSRVPIPFGRYFDPELADNEEALQNASGGIVVEPLLVWSRMTSHGTYQTLKALAVIGQAPIETVPSLQGIMIGGQPIANFYQSNYAVFWKSTATDNRIYLSDLQYGDAAEGNNAAYGIFTCPTLTGVLEPGFSMASSPANTTSFGVYQSIPNGGHFRVNWQVVSIPFLEDQRIGEADPNDRLRNERRKIAGMNADEYFNDDERDETGMPGTGRAYSYKMGVCKINGTSYTTPTEISVNRDDVITFRIDGGQYTISNINLDSRSGVTADDINNTANDMRSRADDLLQIGEIFMINRTMLRVTERPNDVWDVNKTFEYKLKVISFTGANREIGVIGTQNIEEFVLSEGGTNNRVPISPAFKGSNYYPLHKVDLGQVRNTRATEVTELGIKSRVFAQANGLCNFNAVPSPNDLNSADGDGVKLSTPVMNKYLKRTSFFMLAVKDVKDVRGLNSGEEVSDSDDLFEGFDILSGATFAVTGNTPVDKYNYIRIKCPARKEYEFRLVPKCATNVLRYEAVQNANIYTLDASGPVKSVSGNSPHYGTFQLTFNAHVRSLESLFDLKEMRSGDQSSSYSVVCTVTSLSHIGTVGNSGGGWFQAFLERVLGNLKPTPANGSKHIFGERKTGEFTFTSKGVTMTVEVDGFVKFMGESWLAKNGTAKAWQPTAFRVKQVTGEVTEDMLLDAPLDLGNTWYATYYNRVGQTSTQRFRADGVSCQQGTGATDYDREFENAAQIKEISAYAELTHSCDDSPEHEIVYVNESSDIESIDPDEEDTVPNYYGLTMLGIKLRSLNQVQSFQQLQVWMPNGISVERLNQGGTGPSNNFADLAYWLLTQEGRSVGQEVSDRLVDRDSFVAAAKFIDNYWMRFDGAITTQVNLRSYLTEIAPLFLCNFVIKNGKFALVPALPVDSSGRLVETAVPIAEIFTDGNIIEGSFELNYLDQSEREDFRAVMKYRRCAKNSLVTEESIMVRWSEEGTIPPKQEVFDMSNYCTRRSHAFAAARYLLSIRRRVDHIVKFTTVPDGLSLSPGDYIRIETAAAPYNSLYNGVVRDDGTIVTPITLENDTYAAYVYRQGSEAVTTEDVTIENNTVTDTSLAGALINIPSIARRFGVYLIEQIELTEDGLVNVTASHFPVFEDQTSKIISDVLTTSNFEVLE